MAQAASSSLPLRRTSRKIKPKVGPDFEYDYVQQRIDQLDHELAASGLSPRVSQVPSSPGCPSIQADDQVSCDLSGCRPYSSNNFLRPSPRPAAAR